MALVQSASPHCFSHKEIFIGYILVYVSGGAKTEHRKPKVCIPDKVKGHSSVRGLPWTEENSAHCTKGGQWDHLLFLAPCSGGSPHCDTTQHEKHVVSSHAEHLHKRILASQNPFAHVFTNPCAWLTLHVPRRHLVLWSQLRHATAFLKLLSLLKR